MFMRTLVQAGVTLSLLAASVFMTLAVSVAEDNLDTTEAVHVEIQSKVHNATGIRYVKNSGICETTPNVTQISGYINVGTNMSMVYFCSLSSRLIYIDQPIGTGFSYGTDTVNSTEAAAPFVWTAFQVLFESQLFSKYASREFIFTTESYGGHYGPSFVTYFEEQNALIASGKIDAVPIVVSALMINDGWYDPLIQTVSYLSYVTYAPGYGQLQPDVVLKNISDSLYGPDGCVAQENACYAAGTSTHSDKICRDAESYCNDNVFIPAAGDYDPDDIRQNSSALFPPEYYVYYLRREDVMKKIGAQVKYEECPDAPYDKFVKTGDIARTWLPQLSALANSRMKILIWAGDADMNCNWLGGHASVLAMDWYGNETLHNTPFTNMTINGTPIAAVQNVDNFSFA
ncbi:Alpha/Beta hydrolase protein [Suillus bovinus]|uniref:Alpha/Beta hydrolase protein n=1 Tax=Suillus bovinus TaxID=48563 RepID=UPI001B87A19F|nr:Alpha/Beta hydrolase protein [Suillus bovinus]KAG2158088.1 Alpha/Beta hydrolase protein [Suillus bovinus]